jgi:hypothetical protein
LTGTHTDTGEVIIIAQQGTITDWPTLAFSYAVQSADVAKACMMELVFKIAGSDDSIVDNPDHTRYQL